MQQNNILNKAKLSFYNWRSTTLGNKVGTILWGISSLIYLVLTILSTKFFGKTPYGRTVIASIIGIFIIYTAISILLYLKNYTVKIIAKYYGYSLIFNAIILIIGLISLSVISSSISNIAYSSYISYNRFSSSNGFLGTLFPGLKNTLRNLQASLIYNAKIIIYGGICCLIAQLSIITASFTLQDDTIEKSKWAALVLALLSGSLALHLFYTGKIGKAIWRIILTSILPFIGGICLLIDIIKILSNTFKDANGHLLSAHPRLKQNKEFKYCMECGAKLAFTADNCDSCGTEQENERTQSCILTNEKYCIECGKTMSVSLSVCPHCNTSQILPEDQIKEINYEPSQNQESIQSTNTSNLDELKKLKEFLDTGIISQEEFDAKKKQILGL